MSQTLPVPTTLSLIVKKTLKLGIQVDDPVTDFAGFSSLAADTSWETIGNSLEYSDLDQDGFIEILLGAGGCSACFIAEFDHPMSFAGGIYVLSLNRTDDASHLIRREFSITPSSLAEFGVTIPSGSEFGYSMAFFDDMDFDGLFGHFA